MKQKLTRGLDDTYRRQYAKLLAKRYGTSSGDMKVIVVTGRNGKATTAKYLKELLLQNDQTVALLEAKPHESLGVKQLHLFLRQVKKQGSHYAIIVLSPEDIRLHGLVGVSIEMVIVTNTTDDSHESVRQLLNEKPRFIVLNRDDEYFEEMAAVEAASQTVTYGKDEAAEARIDRITLYRKGSEVSLIIDHQTKLKLATYLVGTANVYNLTAAVTALYVMGESILEVDDGIARLESAPTNYEYLATKAPYSVVLDVAPNAHALKSVVATAKELAKRRLIVVIQADITTDEEIETLVGLVDRLIVVDVNDDKADHGTLERVVSPDGAVKLALRTARQDDTVLLAGPIFARPDTDGVTFAHVIIEHTV